MTPSTTSPSITRTVSRLKELKKVVRAVAGALPVHAVGFYAAIAAPLLYLPLLGGQGGLTASEVPLFAALLIVNAGALVLGRDYHRSDE